jgi:hypothetical protein
MMKNGRPKIIFLDGFISIPLLLVMPAQDTRKKQGRLPWVDASWFEKHKRSGLFV